MTRLQDYIEAHLPKAGASLTQDVLAELTQYIVLLLRAAKALEQEVNGYTSGLHELGDYNHRVILELMVCSAPSGTLHH